MWWILHSQTLSRYNWIYVQAKRRQNQLTRHKNVVINRIWHAYKIITHILTIYSFHLNAQVLHHLFFNGIATLTHDVLIKNLSYDQTMRSLLDYMEMLQPNKKNCCQYQYTAKSKNCEKRTISRCWHLLQAFTYMCMPPWGFAYLNP